MLITTAGRRPFALAVTAQIKRHGMFDRYTAFEQRVEKMIPASSLIAHAMDKHISFFARVAPLPVVKLQTIMYKIALSRFQIHELRLWPPSIFWPDQYTAARSRRPQGAP